MFRSSAVLGWVQGLHSSSGGRLHDDISPALRQNLCEIVDFYYILEAGEMIWRSGLALLFPPFLYGLFFRRIGLATATVRRLIEITPGPPSSMDK